MGDKRKQALCVQFDGKLKLAFCGPTITSDAGLLTYRELDKAFRLTEKGSTVLADPRHGKNTQHTMLAMLRQAIYGRLTLPRSVKHWSLTTLREKLIKIGAKVVTHSRYVIFPRWPRWRCRVSCSQRSWTASSGSVFLRRWCGVGDARDRVKRYGFESEQGLTLRGNGPEWLSRRHQG